MPKLIKLNNYGTLGISIPKAICETTGLKPGDEITMEIKSIDPIIIAFRKNKKIEW